MFLNLKELGEVSLLIEALDGLTEIAVDPIQVYDSNGDLAGIIKSGGDTGHIFEYGEPED